MSMTCDLVKPAISPVTGRLTHTTGIILKLTCDICLTHHDAWMPAVGGHLPTRAAQRHAARMAGWRFNNYTTPSGRVRTRVICPHHTQPFVPLDIRFDTLANRVTPTSSTT